MRTRSQTLIAVVLAVGWMVMVATLGGLAWWKVSHVEPSEDDSREPLLRADVEDDDRPGNVPTRLERYSLPPTDDKVKLPTDLPLPTIPKVDLPPP